jgi:hypothetical protein
MHLCDESHFSTTTTGFQLVAIPTEISMERQFNSISHAKFKNSFKVQEVAEGRMRIVHVLRSGRHRISCVLTIKTTGIGVWRTTKE